MNPSSPGFYIEEIPSGIRSITGIGTSIAAFVGWAPQGPTNQAGHVLNWADYASAYGGLHPGSVMSYALFHFFANGGQEAYIVRLVSADAEFASLTVGSLTLTATGEGTWAEEYGVVAAPQNDDANRFDLTIFRGKETTDRQTVEVFENLSLNPADDRFVKNVIDDHSQIVNATVAANGIDVPYPAEALLRNGVDGFALTPGSPEFWTATAPDAPGDAQQGGIYQLDRVDLFNLLCVPGLTDRASLRALAVFCQERRAFLIADAGNVVDEGAIEAISGAEGANAAIYCPWVEMVDPLGEGQLRAFPPSGAVAGIYARTDTAHGVWKAPAGVDARVIGAQGVEKNLTDAESGSLNKMGINAIRDIATHGPVVWGARTCRGNDEIGSEWKYVPVRRTALFIEETLFRHLTWAVFEPNDEPLWVQIRLNVDAFLHDLFRQGAFAGSTPRDAYFVKCDKETTNQSDINLGIVNILVGFAPLKPAEFVIVKLQQMAGQIRT